MKTKQEIQLELLKEIDEICSKNDLKYIFVEQKALYAYLNRTLNDDYRMIAVAMTQGDLDRFCEICTNELGDDRYIEGTFNNPHFIPIYVSYGNRNTTDLDTIYRGKNIHRGIRIRIYPIMKYLGRDGKVYKGWGKRLRKERTLRRLLNKQVEHEKLGYMRTGLRVLNGAYSLTGGGTRYYKEFKKNIFIDKWEDIQDYCKVRIVNKYFPTEVLKDITKIEIDGVELFFPKDTEEYFIEAYGKNFREKSIKSKKLRNRVVIDTEIGYEKVIADTKDILKEIRTTHEEIILKRREVQHENDAVRNVWRLVRMTEKQIEFQDYFTDDKIDELEKFDLNDENQFEEAYEEIGPVVSALRRYAKFGMTFSINPRMDSLIEKVLLISGNEKLLNNIKEFSKKEYFAE